VGRGEFDRMNLFVYALVFSTGLLLGVWGTYKYLTPPQDTTEDKPCPHGFTDWDECPDCSH
jgi:hypothetical protein